MSTGLELQSSRLSVYLLSVEEGSANTQRSLGVSLKLET